MNAFARMIVMPLLILAGLLTGLGVATLVAVGAIERRHPPAGQFVEVPGGRLHVVDLAPQGPAAGPPVVLLHGASGNLEDMRLALAPRLADRRVILIDRPGHGWSERIGGDADAAPARQAELVAAALARLGVDRAVMVAHSWSGALGAAFALGFPERLAGLVLVAPVTHPWPTAIAWHYRLATIPVVGPLFARTLAWPLGSLLIDASAGSVFAPQAAPDDYVARAALRLVLRPDAFLANARDVADLKVNVARQAPRYRDIRVPTVVIHGEADTTVSPVIHARAFVAAVPTARLVLLPGTGHMPHHTAPDVVVAALERLSASKTAAVAP